MDKNKLIAALAKSIPQNLATDLVEDFLQLRQDVATATLGRSSGGKIIETTVQILEQLESGKYSAKPDIDKYLLQVESKTGLDEGLRVCAARLARSMYAIRSKRNIVHKGNIDSNEYDQRLTLHGAEWFLAELLRLAQGLTMQEAGELIEMVHAPVGALVEDFPNRRLVLPDLNIEEELLVLLHSHYPAYVPVADIKSSLNRRNEGSVANSLRDLWGRKLAEGSAKEGYRLTQLGFNATLPIIREAMAKQP
ncbi:MAG: hypothetical protein WBD25_10320 [Terriglobales bacterium]